MLDSSSPVNLTDPNPSSSFHVSSAYQTYLNNLWKTNGGNGPKVKFSIQPHAGVQPTTTTKNEEEEEGNACTLHGTQLKGGRKVMSLQGFQQGDLLWRETTPYLLVVDSTQCHQVCSYCLVELHKTYRCTGCEFVHYCSSHCQKEDWVDHQIECRFLKSKAWPTSMRLILRAIYKKIQEDTTLKENQGSGLHWSMLFELLAHPLTLKEQEMVVCMAQGIQHILKNKLNTIHAKEFLTLTSLLKTNGFSVTNYTLGIYPCAQGVYLGSSLVNHACDPNAIVLFEGRQLVLKCLRPIQVGDEIVISYCDPCLSRKARQRQLLETYHFLCTCTRCEVEKKMEDEEISSNNLHSKRKKDQNDEDLPQLHELSLEALTQLERSFSSPHDAHLQSIRLDTLYALKRPGQSVENPALLSLAQRIHATYVHHLKPWHPFSIVAELDVLELRYLWYVNSSSSLPPPCSLSQLKQHFQEWIQIAKVWFNDQQLLQWKVENLQYGIFKYLS